MKIAIICNEFSDSIPENFDKYYFTTWYGYFRHRSNINAYHLYSDSIDNYNNKYRSQLDEALIDEASINHNLRWCGLAYLDCMYRLFNYLNFKLRIEKIIKDDQISLIYLDSTQDGDLLFCLKQAGIKNNIQISTGNDIDSKGVYSLANGGGNDLSGIEYINPTLLSLVLSFYFRLLKNKKIFLKYSNLLLSKNISFFNLNYLSILGRAYNRFIKRSSIHPFQNKDAPFIDPLINLNLKSKKWQAFNQDEICAISTGINNFYKKISNDKIDSLAKQLSIFLKYSGIQEFVLPSVQTPSSRLIIYACHKHQIKTSFLPHGLTVEKSVPLVQSSHMANHVYAWNSSSANEYSKLGIKNTIITHPSLLFLSKINTNNHYDISINKIVVLLGGEQLFTPDQFEKGLYELIPALLKTDLKSSIYWKFHSSPIQDIQNAYYRRMELASNFFNIKLNIIDPKLKISKFYKDFDLFIICGATTAIYELTCLNKNFIVYFPAEVNHVGGLKFFELNKASNAEDLVSIIKKNDFKINECINLKKSLLSGEIV